MNEPAFAAVYHEVLLALAHEASDEAFFGLLAERARTLSGSESAAVVLLRGELRDELEFAGAAGEDAAELRGTRIRAADSRAGEVARTGEPHLSARPATAILPLFHSGRSAGALVVSGSPEGAFSGWRYRPLSRRVRPG
jgi:hypothetical protein